jgi:hypothetical protein
MVGRAQQKNLSLASLSVIVEVKRGFFDLIAMFDGNHDFFIHQWLPPSVSVD